MVHITQKYSFVELMRGIDGVADALVLVLFWQSYGIKVGYGGIPGPSGGRDGGSAQGGGCCS